MSKVFRKAIVIACAAAVSGCATPSADQPLASIRQPVIDMHLHSPWEGSGTARTIDSTLVEMEENNVVLAVLGLSQESDAAAFVAPNRDRFVGGVETACAHMASSTTCYGDGDGFADLGWVREQAELGNIGAIHEILTIYRGMAPDDPRMAPYWTLAEELNLPVGIHIGRGPPPNSPFRTAECCPEFDEAMGNPALLRPVLDAHPRLRLWLEHVGAGGRVPGTEPYTDETMALLRDYPNVYLDLSITNFVMTSEIFEKHVKLLFDAGFGDRVMFGSDNLPMAPQLARINAIGWLTPRQKRAILYDNAARFLRLPLERIARDYSRP